MLDSLKWLLFDANSLSDERRYWIGFLVSLACFAIASYCAKQVKSNPRLFTALALFAGAWVARIHLRGGSIAQIDRRRRAQDARPALRSLGFHNGVRWSGPGPGRQGGALVPEFT